MKLIIVESPTKARTISQFLDNNFLIESSYGHLRDLPKSKMGVKIENNFEPEYIVPFKKRKIVGYLKKISRKVEEIYFATDEDREGEAIAWHIAQILDGVKNEKVKTKNRICFYEITKEAVQEALKNPRPIDLNLVKAQQTRRILDRLVGYELSPFLWRKIAKKLSAGRVQSPTLRLIVEREKEIQNFKPQEYWLIKAIFSKQQGEKNQQQFEALLYKISEKTLDKFAIKKETEAKEILENLKDAQCSVFQIIQNESEKNPPPPFITSTLQRQANQKFGFSAKKTMLLAQQLYEGIVLGREGSVGLITYMRTDSFHLAKKFLNETRDFIKKNFPKNYLPEKTVHLKIKSKLAQEAHEAIRPTSIFRQPEMIKNFLTIDQFKIYQLIWQRSLACQMSAAQILNTTVEIVASKELGHNYYFRTSGRQIKFDGWLKIYPEKLNEVILPPLVKGENLKCLKVESFQHFTEPPARYSEASLIRALEKYGIGRPSTYAIILSTIQERNYVRKEKGQLQPTEIGFLVNNLLVKNFPQIVDYQFTAKMENDLDKIALGKIKWQQVIQNFYWPFKKNLEQKEKEILKKDFSLEKTDEICEKCGQSMIVKFSRFGKFLACTGFPECKFTKSLNSAEKDDLELKCPKCIQGQVVRKKTKRGKFFYGCCRYPDCNFASWQKPK